MFGLLLEEGELEVTGQVLGAKIMETGSPLLFLGGSYGQYRSN